MLMPLAWMFINEIMTRESVTSDDPFLTCLIVESQTDAHEKSGRAN